MRNSHTVSRTLFAVLAAAAAVVRIQAQAPATLEKQLESEYALTTPTADNTAIVTTGSVLVLQKKGLSAGLASNKVPTQNTYKDGQIKAGAAEHLRRGLGAFGAYVPGGSTASSAAGTGRDFVNGEKLFVTRIDVDRNKDAVVFYLISDAYDAGRYTASLKVEFPKGTLAKGDMALVQPVLDQVFKIAPPDQQAAAAPAAPESAPQGAPPTAQQAASGPAPVSAAPLPDIPPPPPPPADPAPPKSVSVGQTIDQVVAIMGQPKNIVDLGAKKIYVYDGVKVTFMNGKMTAAE